MNERIRELVRQAGLDDADFPIENWDNVPLAKFAELIVRECIDKIETYRIPVGNSAAGEMACEWTYDALKEIRDEIKQHFGVEDRAVPILSADEQALFAGIASSKLFTIEGAKKQFGVEE
jgi:hypothetical protein